MWKGVVAGLLAGAFWGFSFLVPKALPQFPSSLIALGRFAVFGLVSALLLAVLWSRYRALVHWRLVRDALFFALLGNSLYYFTLVSSIQLVGVPLSSLLIGLLPVSIALAGKEKGFPSSMYFALFLIFLGILAINWDVFQNGIDLPASDGQKLLGIFLSLLALAMWTSYAVWNSAYVKKRSLPGSLWTSLVGVLAGLSMVIILGIEQAFSPVVFSQISGWKEYLLWSLVLGLGASWLATYLWNFASKSLPTSLSGQLIVSETVFALLYAYLWDKRFPRLMEWVAFVLLISGVILALRLYQKQKI